jgi:hypothetical protein
MGTFDVLFGDRAAKESPRGRLAREMDRADGAVRRVAELKRENAQLKLELRRVRDELATLRRCLGDGQ